MNAILIFVLSLIAVANSQRWPWKIEDCGGPDAIVKLREFDLSPLPLVITRKNHYEISAKAELLKELPVDAVISINVRRSQRIFTRVMNITLPCFSSVLGSCRLPFRDYFEHRLIKKTACNLLQAVGRPCDPDIKPGELTLGKRGIDLDLNVPVSIHEFFRHSLKCIISIIYFVYRYPQSFLTWDP